MSSNSSEEAFAPTQAGHTSPTTILQINTTATSQSSSTVLKISVNSTLPAGSTVTLIPSPVRSSTLQHVRSPPKHSTTTYLTIDTGEGFGSRGGGGLLSTVGSGDKCLGLSGGKLELGGGKSELSGGKLELGGGVPSSRLLSSSVSPAKSSKSQVYRTSSSNIPVLASPKALQSPKTPSLSASTSSLAVAPAPVPRKVASSKALHEPDNLSPGIRFQSLPGQVRSGQGSSEGVDKVKKSSIAPPGFLVSKVKELKGGAVSPGGIKHPRKGDLVWFNTLASTSSLAAQAASGSPPQNDQDGGSGVSDTLLIPGEVIEYHPKGNVLILKSHANLKDDPYTVENNPQNVRRRIGDLKVGPNHIGYPDMICMNDLSEPAIIWNVKERYGMGEIYTYVGSILISVNPYKMFDIYGLPVVKKYEGKVLGALPPHLFAISSAAYTRMAKDSSPQVIIISGESGSGKTEATKLIMGYLALVNKSPSNLITEQILEANPLLESFGNAKTGKNDNSSRFGKYLQVYFNTATTSTTPTGSNSKQQNATPSYSPIITGCRITEYLLEKSRIVTHNEQERNYHVFYELLRGLSKEQKEKYGLLSAEKYFYLNQGGNCTIPGKHDAEDFQALLSAMQILGFNNEEINNIFKILASVLHLGNVYFHRKSLKHGVEGVEIGSDVEVQWIGHLLELNPDGIRKALTSRTTEARGEKVMTPLTIDQSLDARDAIAKVLYSSLFSWLVQRINRIVYKGDGGGCGINILDIFGFEDFKVGGRENTFEQLLINYANESLQHVMNKHIFKLEQQEYVKEKIEWTLISFEDNLPVINLLTKKPVGILHLLDDESNFPKGTDASFLEKCHYNHALNEHYLRPRMNCNEFGVKHYAGPVLYNVEGFLEKNRDMVRSDVLKLLASSRCSMIARMFGHVGKEANPTVYHYHGPKSPKSREIGGVQGGNTRFITMKPRAPTVAARFHDNLTHLLDSMSKCSPWFVRCVKPNGTKTPMKFDVKTVSNQLRYSGILETIRIRKLGYPIRYSFSKFAVRYKCLVQNNYSISARDVTRMILTSYAGDDYQLGSSKVFLREILEQKLENARYDLTHGAAVIIQSAVRSYLARKRYRELVSSVVKIQAFYRMHVARWRFIKMKKGVIKLQALIRMKREKSRYNNLLKRMNRNKDLCVTGVNHLEIPAELAFMMSKIDHEDQVVEFLKINKSKEFEFEISDLSSYSFDKYVRVFFKSNFGMRREPIISPFLKESPEEALTLFKLILRFMNDPNLSGKREVLLMNYIVSKGMGCVGLRDEILVQVLNQTKNNENKLNCDRGWVLLASCLSCFQPSDNLYNYLLNYSFNENTYSSVIQLKLLQMGRVRGAVRSLPPFGLEYRGIKGRCQMWVEVDGVDVRVESWSTVDDVGGEVGRVLGFSDSGGFGVEGGKGEVASYSFVFDHLNEEASRSYPFKFSVQELFGGQGVKIGAGGGGGVGGRGVQGKLLVKSGGGGVKSRSMESLLSNGNSGGGYKKLGLSSSRLNERYHSIEGLDDGGREAAAAAARKASVARKLSTDYFDLDEEDVAVSEDDEGDEEESVKVSGNSRIGNPRFIKSTAKSVGSGGVAMRSVGSSVYGGSRMYIERGEGVYGMLKSSALSDTSEAPSLASHVRRVRVPSQASDVDQFLDDLFSPVLENLDDLSDARSLITSIKGGTDNNPHPGSPIPENTTTFLQSAFAQNLQIQQQLIAQNQALQQLLQQTLQPSDVSPKKLEQRVSSGGGTRPPPPPPPLPPSPLQGHRPFIDPYGRAKTVRIGKWRWPPKGDDLDLMGVDDFAVFKQRVEEARKLDSNDGSSNGDSSFVWPGDEEDDSKSSSSSENKLIGLVGGRKVARPFGGDVVGKLKLSNEMRMKLEQVTSVRLGKGGGAPKIPVMEESRRVVKKLDESRRNVLEQKLGGGGGGERVVEVELNRGSLVPPPPPPMMPGMGKAESRHFESGREVASNKTPTSDYSSFEHSNVFLSSFKLKNGPSWRLRKECFMPGEEISGKFGEFLKAQVLRDIKGGSPRILEHERRVFEGSGDGFVGWKEVVEVAKTWEIYFWRLFRVQTSRDVSYLAISSKGIKLVSVVSNANNLNVVEFYSWSHITSVTTPKPQIFALQTHSSTSSQPHQQNFFTAQADMIKKLCLVFYNSSIDSFKRSEMQRGSGVKRIGSDRAGKHEDVLHVSNNRFIKREQQERSSGGDRFFGGRGKDQVQGSSPHNHHHNNVQQPVQRFNQSSPLPPPPPPPPPPPQTSSSPQHINSNSPSPTYPQSPTHNNHHYRSTSLSSPPPQHIPQSDPYKNTRHHSIDTTISSEHHGSPAYQDDGKHSLLQFAMKYFRQDKFNLASALHGSGDPHERGGKDRGPAAWTWRDQIGLVKYSPKMIECSLLPMDEEMNRVAMECYASFLKYIGDWQRQMDGKSGTLPGPEQQRNNTLQDVEAVYCLLRNCHNSPVILRDEVYCQAMKQTTNNTSKSAQRAWRLFTILAAYFTCSEVLRPYLFKYLETNAYDKRRAFHGTALVCLQNLRKTFKYGGRRNVPSVEEITAITAGRNAKRQIFRLPGGTQRVVNIKATTVVQDVIDELCGMLNIVEAPEAEEFSVYCIVEGDTFTMPLQKEEYILDVTTELQKNQQTFYLIFCRSVWNYPLRLDSALYVEVVFNQSAPDYLEGLLLTMPGQCLTQNQVYDISKIAALLHRAADLTTPPSLKETKYLLPKPALAARDMRPNQWVSLVNKYWEEENMGVESFSPMNAKAAVLEILSTWDLFGSSFFSVKRLADPAPPEEYIMALNKNGVHFLDIITHETLNWWSYSEIISTRKVKNEDGILYLDMKTGNLMQTRITRFQTEHAHEISRLIRQYIHIQKYSKEGASGGVGQEQHSPQGRERGGNHMSVLREFE